MTFILQVTLYITLNLSQYLEKVKICSHWYIIIFLFIFQLITVVSWLFNCFKNQQDFIEKYGQDLVVVQEMMKNMKTLFKELVEYYCLDPKKTNMDEFFAVIYKFILEYQVSYPVLYFNNITIFFKFVSLSTSIIYLEYISNSK